MVFEYRDWTSPLLCAAQAGRVPVYWQLMKGRPSGWQIRPNKGLPVMFEPCVRGVSARHGDGFVGIFTGFSRWLALLTLL